MTTYQPNPHANLLHHLERHQYTEGQYKGHAPADKTRRHKAHFRVLRLGQNMVVQFHSTNLLTAHPDGTITLNTDSWHNSPTTREAMAVALGLALGRPGRLRTVNLNGYKNTVLSIYGVASCASYASFAYYAYYDGMQLDPTGELLTNPAPLLKRVKDKTLTKAFLEAAQPFRDVLPVLHSAYTYQPGFHGAGDGSVADLIDLPGEWPDIVRAFYRPTAKETWQAIYRVATKDMNTTIEVQL